MTRFLDFDGQSFVYSWWNGERLSGTAETPISLDTETELIRPYRPLTEEEISEGVTERDLPTDPLHVPRPSLGMAYDGDKLVLIHPSKFEKFFTVNKHQHFVGHNWSFDHSVIMHHHGKAVTEVLWTIGDASRLHDSMILDQLLQLATGKLRRTNFGRQENARMYPTDLGTLSKEYECGELDKDSPYRLRFGEFLGMTQEQIDAHPEAADFYSYALADVIATWRLFKKQRVQALELMWKVGWTGKYQERYEIRHDAVEKFGVLSEALQTKASVVLAELSRTPLKVDRVKRDAIEKEVRQEYQQALNTLLLRDRDLIKYYPEKSKLAGQMRVSKKTGLPQFNQKRLMQILEEEASEMKVAVKKSDGKTKATSTSAKSWVEYAERSDFIKSWADLEKLTKLLEFLVALDADVVYSNYRLLMMNGRTSAGAYKRKNKLLVPSLNIQQMPREDPNRPDRSIRALFLPPEGYKWYSCDYGYVELRTLAAICKAKFGFSKLADAIVEHHKDGKVDPHQRTAAGIAGVSISDFFLLNKKEQKQLRQKAKVLNFGFPGGLGVVKMCVYAKTSYGVDMTPAEAKAFKKKWIETYPEMKLYLDDPTTAAMYWQTGRKIPELSWTKKKRVSDFLRGDKTVKNKMTSEQIRDIWEFLEMLAYAKKDEKVIQDTENRELTVDVRDLMHYRSCTFTGRIRNNTKYTDGANTPFSGLAADGAKEALWKLMRNGFQLLSFVHDAIDVAVEPRKAAAQTKTIQKIMCECMESVIGQNIPVAAEGELGDCWSKG